MTTKTTAKKSATKTTTKTAPKSIKRPPRRLKAPPRSAGLIDYAPLLRASEDAIDWALDVAEAIAKEHPEARAKVRNTRRLVYAVQAGRPRPHVPREDVAFTVDVLAGALETDIGVPGLAEVVQWALTEGLAPSAPTPVRPAMAVPEVIMSRCPHAGHSIFAR